MEKRIASCMRWVPLFLLMIPAAAQARIYKWVDAEGGIHYSDSPVGDAASVDDVLPPASIFTLPPTVIPPAAPPSQPPPEAVAPPAPTPSVVAPPADGEFTDDEPSADTEPTAQDNQPNSPDTPDNLSGEESGEEGVGSPSVPAATPDVALTPEAAPENQFGPGSEAESAAAGEAGEADRP